MTTLFSAHRLMEKLVTNSHFSVITSWSFSFFFWLQSFHSRSQWRTHLPPQPIRTRQSWGSSWRRNCRETERLSLRSRSPCWRKVTACFIHLWCCSVALPLLALAMIDGWSEWSDGCHKFPLFYFWLAILIGSVGNVDFLHELKFKGQFTKFLKNYRLIDYRRTNIELSKWLPQSIFHRDLVL